MAFLSVLSGTIIAFENILLSMALKHQLMIAYNQHDPSIVRPVLQATQLSTVDVAVLREDIEKALQDKFPTEMHIQIANNVVYSGTKYAVGMVLANGSTGGLTDFGELIQIVVVKGTLLFIVKSLIAWSVEHLMSIILEKTSTVKVLEPTELSDMFPLTPYVLGGKSIVTLK